MSQKGLLSAVLVAIVIVLASSAAAQGAGKPADVAYRLGSGTILLKGPWERFEGLMNEGSLAGKISRPVYFPLRSTPPVLESPGPATYRMAISLESQAGAASRMALYVPAFSGLSAVYANGQLLYERPRDSAAPPLLIFDAPKGGLSLLLQVGATAQGLEEASLLPTFAILGDAESVGRTSLLLGGLAAFQDGFFILIGLFVFLLCLFWKRNPDFLAFAVFLMATGLFYLLKEGVLFLYNPLDATHIQLETAYVAAADILCIALAFLLRSLYGDRIRLWAALPFYVLPLAHAAATILLPYYFAELAMAGTLYYALLELAALVLSAVLAFKGNRKALWLTSGLACSVAGLALKNFGPESIWASYLIEPAGLALFALVLTLMLLRKVSLSLETTKTLTDYVETVSRCVRNFIPQEFLEHLDKKDFIDLRLGDHTKKEMTIFFSDIRGFTSLSEKLTVEENFAFINSYLSRVVPIIKTNGGFVDKYIGDAIMALFPGPQGPDEAIKAAIEMQTKMVEYNGHRAKVGYKPISMGVGVHTGDLMLGVVGVSDRMENTVISDAVNLSSRLQAITKAFNISLAISEQSFKELEDPGSYKYRFIGKVKVKGKAAPVSVFEIFDGIAPDLFERKMKANMFFEQGMLSYYQKDFRGAMQSFRRVLEIIPEDGAAGFYLDNCMNKAAL